MKIERGHMSFHKDKNDKEQLSIEGTNFYGSINDDCRLIGGYLEKETSGSEGSFFFLFKWDITCNGSKINAVVKVPYTYSNEMKLPVFEDLLEAANSAVIDATNFFNEEMRNKEIQIVPRSVKVLDVEDERAIHNFEEYARKLVS